MSNGKVIPYRPRPMWALFANGYIRGVAYAREFCRDEMKWRRKSNPDVHYQVGRVLVIPRLRKHRKRSR